MSYYNSPGLHVQHMGASHGITVSIHAGSSTLCLMVAATDMVTWELELMPLELYLSYSFSSS